MTGIRAAMAAALLGAGILATGMLATGVAQAQAVDEASVLAGSCANCHGTQGKSPGSIPSIAGMPYRVLAAQLAAFKANEVPNTTIMNRLARGYSDEQLDALARYFSEISE